MTLGTGIFLSVLVASMCALLIATKDKWTWKKLFLYPAIVLVVICGGIFGGMHGYSEGYYGPNKIRKEMSYAGVELRSTKSDVMFAKGKPAATDEKPDDDKQTSWLYKEDNASVLVTFDVDGRVVTISSYVENKYDYIPSLKWISRWTSLETIKQRLGDAEFTQELEDGKERLFRYPKHNLRVIFSKDGIVSIGIRDYERFPLKPTR